ncbi:hypothetical protein HPB49_003170 [Dermacentor silvarum]|uniref:Uncharacterized protein n=1 Tax=Dermacentor silvarum TaxID=543639 RepID=A0ACB8DTT0_DERSI|nr:hypothetical protein HPB49_003170 [Dermacentor silvarum]
MDTSPDLVLSCSLRDVTWSRTQHTLGSDHYMIQVTVPFKPPRHTYMTHKLINWDALRTTRTASPDNPITNINDWVDSLQTDIQHHMQQIETTTDVPTLDSRLAHLWKAYHSLLERRKRDGPKVKKNTQVDVKPQPVDPENDVPDMQPDKQIPAPFQPVNTEAALQKRVAQLEAELQATRRKLQLAQRQRFQAQTANKRLLAGLNKYLNEDQVKCLKMATMRGTRWTKKTVIKALKMRLSCGACGYDSVRELGQPLPTERTLHRHLEGYKFTPGLLEDIMESLALKVSLMSPEEQHATLMLDEMQLAPGLVYNPSSGTVLGAPTIPLADATLPPDCLATHGLVFMLGGITTRWKQTVAYHLTGNSFHAKTVKDIIILIIKACEAISLKVDVVVTDKGGGNQAIWKLFGIIVGKHSKPKTWCPHPCDASRQLFFMADVPHLLKNLRSHLTKGQKKYLPEEVVKKNNLLGNKISIEPIKKLVEIDSNAELKLARHLKPSSVDPSHYDKMKVGPAFSLINSDTAAALRLLVDNRTL